MDDESGSPHERRRAARPATTAPALLRQALQALDPEELARAVGVSVERLHLMAARSYTMSIDERAALAMAIISLVPASSPLFSGAATLRGQVRAMIEYRLGVTSATVEGPRISFVTPLGG